MFRTIYVPPTEGFSLLIHDMCDAFGIKLYTVQTPLIDSLSDFCNFDQDAKVLVLADQWDKATHRQRDLVVQKIRRFSNAVVICCLTQPHYR